MQAGSLGAGHVRSHCFDTLSIASCGPQRAQSPNSPGPAHRALQGSAQDLRAGAHERALADAQLRPAAAPAARGRPDRAAAGAHAGPQAPGTPRLLADDAQAALAVALPGRRARLVSALPATDAQPPGG